MLQGSRHDRILIKEEYEKEKEQRENGKGGRGEGEDTEKEGVERGKQRGVDKIKGRWGGWPWEGSKPHSWPGLLLEISNLLFIVKQKLPQLL